MYYWNAMQFNCFSQMVNLIALANMCGFEHIGKGYLILTLSGDFCGFCFSYFTVSFLYGSLYCDEPFKRLTHSTSLSCEKPRDGRQKSSNLNN